MSDVMTRNEGIFVRLPPELMAKIDRWRRQQENPPSRPEAARRIIEVGLREELHEPQQKPKGRKS